MELTAQTRGKTGKESNKKLRANDLIPGIIYGKEQNHNIMMKTQAIHKYIQTSSGVKKVVNLLLETDNKKEEKQVILQDFQLTSLGNKLLHVDFLEVSNDTILTVDVPIKTTDDSIAVKMGGTIQIIRRTVPVTCKAKDIPEFFMIDVKELQYGESVHVLDINYPEGIKPVVTGRNFTILTIAGKTKEEEKEVSTEAVEGEGTEEGSGEEAKKE